MRIVAGAWRGRTIQAPRSRNTRPTADRVRQAVFDMLAHAPWADAIEGCAVLDAFAGSGALGLEALSRGASRAVFFENDRAALDVLRANVASLDAASRSLVSATSAIRPARPPASQGGCGLVFLDPPYGQNLIRLALGPLRTQGWIAPGALIVAEAGKDEEPPVSAPALLAERRHGMARISVWRDGGESPA